MVVEVNADYLTQKQYLELESQSLVKHEYIDGKIYRMAGASDAHVTIAGNLFAEILPNVRGLGCRVYIADMKVYISSLNRFYYPDIMVTCEALDKENSFYKQFPILIVEVLSDSTEAFDRGDKFADYQTIETLQEYVLISTKKQRIESFRRSEQGLWTLQIYTASQVNFELKSINYQGQIGDIYLDTAFL